MATPTLPPSVARYTELVAVSWLVEARLNCCNALQVFAFVRFKDATTSPVVGEMVGEPAALETEDTAPEPPPTQVPLIAKHPLERLRPFANVEVADDEVIFKRFA